MERMFYPHKIVLLSTGLQMSGGALWFGRARLYPDRIELTGWNARGSYRQVIFLDRITDVRWERMSAAGAADAVIRLHNGADVALRLHQGGRWKTCLEERIRWSPWRRLYAAREGASIDEMPLRDVMAFARAG